MPVRRVEVGLVSANEELVAFYESVFELKAFEPRTLPIGTIHRLGTDEPLVKIIVPASEPTAQAPASPTFWGQTGIRYFALWVDDIEGVAARCAAHAGASVAQPPTELRPGVWTMIIHDPAGNVLEVMEERR